MSRSRASFRNGGNRRVAFFMRVVTIATSRARCILGYWLSLSLMQPRCGE